MSIRSQNYILIIGLSLFISGILLYCTIHFVLNQKRDNFENSIKAQAISVASLLEQLDVTTFNDPNVEEKINKDYQRIINRITHEKKNLEFYLFDAQLTHLIWAAKTQEQDLSWLQSKAHSLTDEIHKNTILIKKRKELVTATTTDNHYIAFAKLKLAKEHQHKLSKAILVCELDGTEQLALGSNLYYSIGFVAMAALLIAIIIAELTTYIIQKQINKLSQQIQGTINSPGKSTFSPGIIIETNALGDALHTLGTLLLDTLQKTKRTAIEGNVLGTDDRLSTAYREHFASPTECSFPGVSIYSQNFGTPQALWFAGATEKAETITYISGICKGNHTILEDNFKANTCKYRILAQLQDDTLPLEHVIQEQKKEYGLQSIAIISIKAMDHSIDIKSWSDKSSDIKYEHFLNIPDSKIHCHTLIPDNQDFSSIYLENFQHDSTQHIAEELASILKDSSSDIMTLIKFGSS